MLRNIHSLLILCISAFICAIAIPACSTPRALRSISVLARDQPKPRPPIIIIPGTLGSWLADRDTGRVEWLRAAQAFGLEPPPSLAFPISKNNATNPAAVRDKFLSVGIVDKIPVVPGLFTLPVYSPLVDAFSDIGYKVGDCDFPRPDEDAFIFHYDFRRDAAETAGRLARAIERVRDTRMNPDEKVMIVAHSFGGLVARYYLMYGGRDVLEQAAPVPTGEGASNVSAVVYLSTPHHGSLVLLRFMLEGYGALFPGQLITSDEIRTMPAAYQLLPCPSNDCYLDFTNNDRKLRAWRDDAGNLLNIYDSRTWFRFGWVEEKWSQEPLRSFFEHSLTRGYQWWNALEQEWSPPDHLRSAVVGGTAEPTIGRGVLVKNTDGTLKLVFDLPWSTEERTLEKIKHRILTPGDGRVTLESALDLPFGTRLASTAVHDAVHQDPAVLDNIILFLFGEDFLPFTYDMMITKKRDAGKPGGH